MEINDYRALIQYDSEIEMFRGEFMGLNGSADFYANNIEGLKIEGAISLKVFLQMCKEDKVEPKKNFSGKFNVRIPPELHEDISNVAISEGKSLNQWVVETLNYASHP
jgi:predicted HicB family RNase H-like nuclease